MGGQTSEKKPFNKKILIPIIAILIIAVIGIVEPDRTNSEIANKRRYRKRDYSVPLVQGIGGNFFMLIFGH